MGVGSGGDHVNREYCYQLITISTAHTVFSTSPQLYLLLNRVFVFFSFFARQGCPKHDELPRQRHKLCPGRVPHRQFPWLRSKNGRQVTPSPLNFHFNPFLTIQTERYRALNEERQIRGMQPGIYMMTSSL